ncbi:MAG: hypothetical protein PHQ42_00910 [Patescibacteria group bacterium]|nr:hypothetical protein [Patescibacteria group bacterium]
MAKKRFFILIPFVFLLIFSLTGCGKKQEADTDIWSEKKDSAEEIYDNRGRLNPEEGEKEVFRITEVPQNKEDIRKLLDNLEKGAGAIDSDVDEGEFDEAEEEGGYIEDEAEEDISDGDIDAL